MESLRVGNPPYDKVNLPFTHNNVYLLQGMVIDEQVGILTFQKIMRDASNHLPEELHKLELNDLQEAKIEALFNSGSVLFWTVNMNTALTSFNKAYSDTIYKMYGRYPRINRDLSRPKERFATEQYHSFWNEKYSEVITTKKRVYFQTKTKDSSGKTYHREIYLTPILNPNTGNIYEIAGMGIDVTDKMTAEKKIFEQSAKIQAIFNASNHMIWSVDTAGKLTSFNIVFERTMLERYGKKPALGEVASEFAESCLAGEGAKWLRQYAEVFKGDKVNFEHLSSDVLGREHLEDVSLSPIFDDHGRVVEIAGLAQSVTFKRAAERKLKEQAAKINAIFDSSAMLIWTIDRNGRIVSYNKVFASAHFKLLGVEVGIGTPLVDAIGNAVSGDAIDVLKHSIEMAFTGKMQQLEGKILDRKGQIHWMEIFLNPIYLDTGEVKELSCLSHEITEKKEIQQQMLDSIQEKEILLQEVHHRVKNNLQVISSILNLQSSYVKDKNSLNILRESQNRIKSMSFIHESLYHTKNFSRVEFSDYILSLSNNLIHSYSIGVGKVKLLTSLEKVHLNLDQAIPCGLIINELVSNALKYAFPNGNTGSIYLELKQVENFICVGVADDGIGLPKDLDVENSDSLGLQLVYTLADQIDASIELRSEKGTNYLITFEKR